MKTPALATFAVGAIALFACGASPPAPAAPSDHAATSGPSAPSDPAARAAKEDALLCAPLAPTRAALDVVVLGSGGPRAFGRAGSAYAVRIGGRAQILVDTGPGSFLRAGELRLDLGALDTVLVTHMHIDHTGELPGFVKTLVLSRDAPKTTLDVYGPDGRGAYPSTTRFVDGLFGERGLFAYIRTFGSPFEARAHDVALDASEPVVLAKDDAHAITAIATDHADVPSIAYRIDAAGRSVAFSGDLHGDGDHMAKLARGADLLVYDAAILDIAPPARARLHTTPRRIGEIAAAAGVRALLLSHLAPDIERAKDEVLASIAVSYKGPVSFASDCAVIAVGGP